MEDCNGTSSQNNRGRILRSGRKASKKKKKSSKAKLPRPQRAAARNSKSVFSRIPETSSLGEDDEDGSEDESSDSGSVSVSEIQDNELYWDLQNSLDHGGEKSSLDESVAVMEPVEQASVGHRKKLVLKLSVRDTKPKGDDNRMLESSSFLPQKEEGKQGNLGDEDMDLHPPAATEPNAIQNVNRFKIKCKGLLEKTSNHASSSAGSDIPMEASCSGHLEKGSRGDADGYSMENAVDASNNTSLELKEDARPIPTRIKIKSSGVKIQEKTPKLKLVTGAKKLNATEDTSVSYSASHGSDMEENISNTGYYENCPGADFPDAETDVVRRTRSMEIKASTREAGRGNRKLKLRKSERSAGASKSFANLSRDGIPSSGITFRSRSSRTRQDNFFEDDYGPPSTSLSNVAVGKISWLMLSEHEPGYRYIPQLGDLVVYLRQVILSTLISLFWFSYLYPDINAIMVFSGPPRIFRKICPT